MSGPVNERRIPSRLARTLLRDEGPGPGERFLCLLVDTQGHGLLFCKGSNQLPGVSLSVDLKGENVEALVVVCDVMHHLASCDLFQVEISIQDRFPFVLGTHDVVANRIEDARVKDVGKLGDECYGWSYFQPSSPEYIEDFCGFTLKFQAVTR